MLELWFQTYSSNLCRLQNIIEILIRRVEKLPPPNSFLRRIRIAYEFIMAIRSWLRSIEAKISAKCLDPWHGILQVARRFLILLRISSGSFLIVLKVWLKWRFAEDFYYIHQQPDNSMQFYAYEHDNWIGTY